MRAVIIDNEPKVRASLVGLLELYCPTISIVGEAESCSSGRDLIEKYQPEVIFLDIEMDDGTGIDLVRSYPRIHGHVIFITAHDKYAVDAFRCSALDFLLKPVDPDDLVRAVGKAEMSKSANHLQQQIDVLEQYMSQKKDPDAKIVLSDSESIYLIRISEILWCCAEGSYTRFVLEDGSEILVSKNLKFYESLLDPEQFIRTHHSYLVNVNHIKRFERSEGGMVVMDNGGILPVSVRKKDNLMQVLKNWNNATDINL